MVKRESKTELGAVKIHDEVIASIASMAALEVEGVIGLTIGSLPHKISTLLGKVSLSGIARQLQKRGFNHGIKVNTQDDEVKIDVSVSVEYGVSIPHVSKRVQENIKRSIEEMTGLSLSEVNVSVQAVQQLKVPVEAKPPTE